MDEKYLEVIKDLEAKLTKEKKKYKSLKEEFKELFKEMEYYQNKYGSLLLHLDDFIDKVKDDNCL